MSSEPESKSKSSRRVRFSETAEVLRGEAPKRRRLDPMESLEGEISVVCLAENMDAGMCAARRAEARRNHLLAGFEAGAAFSGGGEQGEEDYEEPEEAFNDGGIPIEPFHLKRERELGYFDEDGNYVEYREEVEDAWADALQNVEVDQAWLARVMRGQARAEGEAMAAEEPAMAPEQLDSHKRQVASMLLPGENVLQALRRMARTHRAGGEGDSGRGAPAAREPARHPRALRGAQAMPPAVQERFELLTSLTSQLVGQGMYSVHSMTREQLESGDAADGADLPASAGDAAGRDDSGNGARDLSAAADAGQRLAERLLAAAAGAGAAGGANGKGGAHDQDPGTEQRSAAAAAVDAEQDIFAEDGAPDLAGATRAAADAPGGPPDQLQQPQQQEAQAAGSSPGKQSAATEMEGFELDAASGMLYNSALGMYFDPARRLFGDAATGQWYRLDERTKQYQRLE